MKITFDFNCVIALENGAPSAKYLSKLLSLHDQNKLDICVPAISGVEKLPDGKYSTTLTDLINRLEKLSKKPIKILDTLAYFDMWFLGHGIFGNAELQKLDEEIHSILFPDVEYKLEDFAKTSNIYPDKTLSKWMNNRCDVISMWCHIYHKTDIFVSRDGNFFKPPKLQKLNKLGANKIQKPKEAYKHTLIL